MYDSLTPIQSQLSEAMDTIPMDDLPDFYQDLYDSLIGDCFSQAEKNLTQFTGTFLLAEHPNENPYFHSLLDHMRNTDLLTVTYRVVKLDKFIEEENYYVCEITIIW